MEKKSKPAHKKLEVNIERWYNISQNMRSWYGQDGT